MCLPAPSEAVTCCLFFTSFCCLASGSLEMPVWRLSWRERSSPTRGISQVLEVAQAPQSAGGCEEHGSSRACDGGAALGSPQPLFPTWLWGAEHPTSDSHALARRWAVNWRNRHSSRRLVTWLTRPWLLSVNCSACRPVAGAQELRRSSHVLGHHTRVLAWPGGRVQSHEVLVRQSSGSGRI